MTSNNIVLSALNTRHTHSALGLAYIKAFWEKMPERQPLDLVEFDLNQTNEGIIAGLILLKPRILAFSVYIWSISRTLAIAGALKAAFPEIKIILGGPEVSFNSEEIMLKASYIDFIVRGEGEVTFCKLLESILESGDPSEVAGITWREQNKIIKNADRPFLQDLDAIPSPFRSGIYKGVHSFTYYEASRGCPSRCSYCLSSVLGPVRNHSITRVKQDLDWFFASDYRQVRFADRTFNFDRPRAREIITYIKANNRRNINFHFEIQADFLTEDIIELLSDAPDGMFHLEIGIQSTNPTALRAVNRRFDLSVLRERIFQLRSRTRCHLHLDILGALPADSLQHFMQSLDDVWQLDPHSIQISLVKVLRGTPLQQQLGDDTIAAMPDPPYTILRTKWLAADEAIRIQDIGKLVEGMHNSQRFPGTLRFIARSHFGASASAMYNQMADFWRRNDLQFYNFSPESMAKNLMAFARSLGENDYLRDVCQSLIDHELRLTQKVPSGEPRVCLQSEQILRKHPFRVTQGTRVSWYEFDPVALLGEIMSSTTAGLPVFSRSLTPVVYRFERDLSAIPSIEIVPLPRAEAFALGAIQQRIELGALPQIWAETYKDLPVPDFAAAIEKLSETELLYKV